MKTDHLMLLERLLAVYDTIPRPLDLEWATPFQRRAIEEADLAQFEALPCYADLRKCAPLADRFDQLDEGVITPWEAVTHMVDDLARWRRGERWGFNAIGRRVYLPEDLTLGIGG